MSIAASLTRGRGPTPERYAWIGLDFGTATTECVIRIESAGVPDEVAVLAFGGDRRTNAQVILPTALERVGGKLVPADQLRRRGEIVELLKTRLISEIDRGMSEGQLRRPDGPFAYTLLHLASVLAIARSAASAWTGTRRLRYYLNIAAPVGADPANQRDARIREVFREVAYRALALSERWPQEPPTDRQAEELVAAGMAVRVPGVESSPVTTVPEALAAVTSFLHVPNRRAGNYATIDVGGGTTDISFFWFQTGQFDPAQEKKAWYYAVRNAPVGMSDLLARLKDDPGNRTGKPAHERLRDCGDLREVLSPGDLDEFLLGLDSSYRETYCEAFATWPIHQDWSHDGRARWTTLLLGGGSGCPPVRDHLTHHPPTDVNIREHGKVECLAAPNHLPVLLPDGRILPSTGQGAWRPGTDVIRANGHLLTVAYGLAFRAPDIPKRGVQERVDPPPPPQPWEPPDDSLYNSAS